MEKLGEALKLLDEHAPVSMGQRCTVTMSGPSLQSLHRQRTTPKQLYSI